MITWSWNHIKETMKWPSLPLGRHCPYRTNKRILNLEIPFFDTVQKICRNNTGKDVNLKLSIWQSFIWKIFHRISGIPVSRTYVSSNASLPSGCELNKILRLSKYTSYRWPNICDNIKLSNSADDEFAISCAGQKRFRRPDSGIGMKNAALFMNLKRLYCHPVGINTRSSQCQF